MPCSLHLYCPRFFLVCLLFAGIGLASAQPSLPVPHSRVLQAVDDSRLTTLSGNVHPLARPEFDQGSLADGTPLHRMVLVLQRGPQQEAALDQLINQQQDSSSSSYHQWLTPETFGAAFGPSDRDLSAVTAWLTNHGFSGIQVNAGRTLVEFSGTAGDVRAAFHTAMHRYRVQGEEHFANASNPEIPVALSPVIAGIASLNNFPRKSASHKAGNFRRDVRTNAITRIDDASTAQLQPQVRAQIETQAPVQPHFTVQQSGSTYYGVTPYDFATIYNVLPLWNASTPIDGSGQTIAIVGQTDINAADFVNFRKLFNLPLGNTATPTGTQYLNIIYNGPNPGVNSDEGEADIDTQWSAAVAKGATIDYVVSEGTEVTQGTDLSAIYIVNNNLAPVMSYSYGQCELFLGTAGNAFYNALWQQAAAQGITVLLASGDSGSAGCDNAGVSVAANGLGVNGLGSTPYNVAVGGTDFYMPTGGTAYWNTANDASTQASAKGYIPESPWNESCTNPALASTSIFTGQSPEQVCNNITAANYGLLTVVGGGGGVSSCTRSNGMSPGSCSGGYRKPSWQTGAGVPSDGLRDVPDVSLFSGSGFFGAFYVVCQQSTNPDGQPCSLTAPSYDFAGYGGTSVAAPAFAGILSLVNQKTGNRQGNANYVLYNLANQQVRSGVPCNAAPGTPYAGCVFNDITTGTIAMPCLKSSPNCTAPAPPGRYGILSGWKGATGYDLATGLGSVNAANLVNNWSNATFTATSTSLALSPATITHGSSISATVNVSSTSGTPTGSVSINAIATNGSVQTGTLNNGTYTASLPNFPGGSYSVRAHYAGDGTYAPSDSNPVDLTVSPEPSTTGLQTLLYNFTTGNAAKVDTLPYGSLLLLRADVAGVSGKGVATGNIALTDNGAPLDGGAFRLNSDGYTEDQTSLLRPGIHTIAAAYSGDGSFDPSQSPAATLTVTKSATTTLLLSSPSSASNGSSIQLLAQVLPQGGGYGLPPTGVVTVQAGIVTLGSATLSELSNGGVTISVLAGQLAQGINQISLIYSGDDRYLGSTSSPTYLTVLGSTLTPTSTILTLTPLTVTVTGTLQMTASVTPITAPAPTGTIQFQADGRNFGPTQILAASQAVLTAAAKSLSAGTHSIAAIYSGDSRHQASIATPVTLTVISEAIPSSTTISVTPDTVVQGTSVAVTATITSASLTLGGTAQLLLDGNLYGQPLVLTGFTVTFPITTGTLQPGAHVLQVRYAGDFAHLPSVSAAAALTILNPVGSFTLTPSSTAASAALGTTSSAITLAVTPIGGFRSTVSFACTGLPSGEFCLFTPATLTPTGSGAAMTTLTIGPNGSGALTQALPRSSGWFPVGAGTALASLVLLYLPRRRRRVSFLVLLAAFSVVGDLTGCGAGGIAPIASSPSNNPSRGAYVVTVTAMGGSTIQNATINLTLH